jgi:hypothetical protein
VSEGKRKPENIREKVNQRVKGESEPENVKEIMN